MAKTSQRIFALTAAIVFLISSLGFTGLVIYQMATQNKDEQTSEQQPQQPTNTSQGKKMDGFTPVSSVTELQKIDLKVGTGAEAKPGDTVTVHYTGALAKDGTIFESSKDGGQTVTFGLDQVIQGWGQGVPGMKVGGVRRLVIPAALAYGDQSPSETIPPNSDLVFDIELVDIPPKQ